MDKPNTAVLAAAALYANAAATGYSEAVSTLKNKDQHSSTKGHVCGRSAVGTKKKQSRNKPCMCGSGKKAKRCCVYEKDQ